MHEDHSASQEQNAGLLRATRPGSSVRDQLEVFRKELRLSDRDLAELASVSPSTIRRWRVSEPDELPRPIDNLRAIVHVTLRDGAVDPRSVGRWLRSRNRGLGMERPIQLLADDEEFDRISRAAEAFSAGGATSPEGPMTPDGSVGKEVSAEVDQVAGANFVPERI